MVLTFGAGLAAWRGYQQLVDSQALDRPLLAVAVIALAIVTNGYAVSQSLRKLIAEEGSLSGALRSSQRPLVRTALLQDGLGTLSAIVGLIAVTASLATGIELLDGVGAVVIAGLMALAAFRLVVQAQELITGKSVTASELDEIRAAVRGVPAVVSVNRLVAIYTGSAEILVELDLDLAEHLRTTDIERTLDEIQLRIRTVVPEAQAVRVDLNSPETGHLVVQTAGDRG